MCRAGAGPEGRGGEQEAPVRPLSAAISKQGAPAPAAGARGPARSFVSLLACFGTAPAGLSASPRAARRAKQRGQRVRERARERRRDDLFVAPRGFMYQSSRLPCDLVHLKSTTATGQPRLAPAAALSLCVTHLVMCYSSSSNVVLLVFISCNGAGAQPQTQPRVPAPPGATRCIGQSPCNRPQQWFQP